MSVLSRIAYYQDRRDEMPNQELTRELVTDCVGDFVRLRRSKNNRLVWGSMIALSTVALLRADEIYQQVREIKTAMGKRSIITVVSGVKTLALVATKSDKYKANLFPYLLNHLATCRPKDVPQHTESVLPAVGAENKDVSIAVLMGRISA